MSDERTPFEAPITRVTLLEDRAQVVRRGTITLPQGASRLVVLGVAPVIQDVSLRAHAASANARVSDVRVRRVMRILREDKPAERALLEDRADDIERRFREHADDRARAERQARALRDMLHQSLRDIPEDVSWGRASDEIWRETFEELSRRSKELREQQLEHWFAQQDLAEQASAVANERLALDRIDHHILASLELDVVVDEGRAEEIVLEYTVGNALWRPLHSARLGKDDKLTFKAQAAVWQSTGEDWRDCELVFSTARSSLGTEPPLLSEDRLRAQRRSDEIVVQSRAVKVQRAGVAGGGRAPAGELAIDLPGVDDGGDVQSLQAEGRCSVPADGRPNVVPLFSFEAEAETTLVTMPERSETVLLRSRQPHEGKAPILAGPVELIRDSGGVGYTKTLFVAAGERFELGFGPDDAVRVTRRVQQEPIADPVGKWSVTQHTLALYLSNLSDEEKTVDVCERIPVSEIEHVRITLMEDATDPMPTLDDNGFARWTVALGPHGRNRVKLVWRHAVAPGVKESTSPL